MCHTGAPRLPCGHCVLGVGYDDTVRLFTCQNSWGDTWGDKGFFTLPYDYAGYPPYDNVGHSKGGAEAPLFHGLMKERGHPPRRTVAFEPPRVGTQIFADYMAGEDYTQTQTVNSDGADIVTLVLPLPAIYTRPPIVLTVPDGYDVATKHRMPGVIGGLKALLGTGTTV